ncbi:MAG: hypothetical protein IJ060_07655 [Oscillospiraceae bacterium]|nr:hypothetical protein [Oscillospiraceae bacterium]
MNRGRMLSGVLLRRIADRTGVSALIGLTDERQRKIGMCADAADVCGALRRYETGHRLRTGQSGKQWEHTECGKQ